MKKSEERNKLVGEMEQVPYHIQINSCKGKRIHVYVPLSAKDQQPTYLFVLRCPADTFPWLR